MTTPHSLGVGFLNLPLADSDMADSSADSDSDSDCSPPAKTRKLDGAATYPSRFNSEWKKKFPFVTNVIGDPYTRGQQLLKIVYKIQNLA